MVEYFRHNPEHKELDRAADIIARAFSWGSSSEGFTYWNDVCVKLRGKAHKQANVSVKVLGREISLSKDAKAALDKVLAEIPELKKQLIGE